MISAPDTRLPASAIRAIILGAIFGFLLEIELKGEAPNYLLVAILAALTVLPLLHASRLEDQADWHL